MPELGLWQVVLAAGASQRMGQSKAHQDVHGRSALGRVVETAREAELTGSVVVVRQEAEALARTLQGALVVVNHRPEAGRTGSLQRGLAAIAAEAAAILVHPVDHPLVRPETLVALRRAWAAAEPRPALCEPLLGARKGHPILLDASLFKSVLALEPDAPLFVLAREARNAGRSLDVAVDDPGVVANLDTPTDRRRWGL